MSSAARKIKRKKKVENKKSAKKSANKAISEAVDQMKNLSGTSCSFCDKLFHMSMAADWRINYKPGSSVPIMLVCNNCFDDEDKKQDILEAFRR